MAEVNQNFGLFAGETKTLVCGPVLDRDVDDEAVDLTGATITWILKSGSTMILTKTVGVGITLATQSGATLGVFYVAWTAANGASLLGTYQHEARVTLADGDTIATVFTGTLTVSATLIP